VPMLKLCLLSHLFTLEFVASRTTPSCKFTGRISARASDSEMSVKHARESVPDSVQGAKGPSFAV
jgi:hypothetical protein